MIKTVSFQLSTKLFANIC